jgi:hypothetical protein
VIFIYLTNFNLLNPIIDMRRPSSVAKKIEMIDTDTVKPSPEIKKLIFVDPN